MSPDLKRLCEAAQASVDQAIIDADGGRDVDVEAIVRAVLTELRETPADFDFDNGCVLTAYGLDVDDGQRVTEQTVAALVDYILAEPSPATETPPKPL